MRSMRVLTSIETESAFMGNLHGRRREMVDMTETNLGHIVQDFHWMVRTDLHLSQCQQKKREKKLLLGGHHTLFVLHIVLLDCFVADQKQEVKSLIFGEYQCGKRLGFIFELS